ncbi:MAG: leucine-rich repeat domain-containing protein [Alphaproteobacteria bacterium]|nr:leucine-rich repeat domain-containing protein [Alphaproteobacteria bacterium]
MKNWILILGLMASFHANAAIIAEGDDCGDNCHWQIDDETHTLSIAGIGKMKNYNTQSVEGRGILSAAPWFEYDDKINTVTVGEGMTSIGNNAFRAMHLENVNLPEGLEEIGYGAFMTHSLKHIDLPSSLTKIKDIAFQDAPLEDIELPSNLQSIGWGAFANTKISSIILPETVKSLNAYAFGDDTTLNGYYKHTPLQSLYCPEHFMTQCENAVAFRANLGQATDIFSYQTTPNGQIFYNNKWYNNANDILTGNYIQKRIYTIEEANQVSGKVNRVSIRYK